MEGKIKKVFLCSLMVVAILFAPPLTRLSLSQDSGESQSDQADKWWKDRADTNKDGVLDDAELFAWKKLEIERIDSNRDKQIDDQEIRQAWKYAPSPVSTDLEQKFDANGNGWLEPEEARKLLFRRVDELILQNKGKGPIKTWLEEFYDTNEDGILDLEELKNLREDLK
jgi:hypothetical protein